ncbi:MAG TPA: acetylornithine transaminase, partial [Hyphomicrobiaceae bacterium]|nr:acetylornithine transaminase [Hyphomicrobiaceae bacterium]
PLGEVVDACMAEKLLTVGAGDNVVRLLPPLNVTEDELSEAVARLGRALARLPQAAR